MFRIPRNSSVRAEFFAAAMLLATTITSNTVQAHDLNDDSASAVADETTKKPAHKTRHTAYMTGDWWGYRNSLEDRGINLHADIVNETMGVARGGLKQGLRSASQVRFGSDFDLQKLFGLPGGTLHITLNDRFGRGTSTDLGGNRLPIQEVYSSQFVKITELSYEQQLFSNRLDIRVGLWSMGNAFGGLPMLCDFVNAAFCAHPLTLSANSGWGNYPNSRLGASVQWIFSRNINLTVGGIQINPDYSEESHAFSLDPHGTLGAIFPVQLELKTGDGIGPDGYPGDYKLGGYFDNSTNLRKNNQGYKRGRGGYFFMGHQQIFHESGNSSRGLTMFGQFTSAQRSTAAMASWLGAGFIYTGTFPGRDQDTVGIGYIRAKINKQLIWNHFAATATSDATVDEEDALPDAEAVFELEYGIQVTPYLIIRPDLQYIVDPGAFSFRRTPNIIAAGFQVKLVL